MPNCRKHRNYKWHTSKRSWYALGAALSLNQGSVMFDEEKEQRSCMPRHFEKLLLSTRSHVWIVKEAPAAANSSPCTRRILQQEQTLRRSPSLPLNPTLNLKSKP